MRRRLSLTLALVATMALLAACDTAEQRAERHFNAGLEYLQAGDIDRALVEFRNVFKLNGEHHDARLAYAEAERGRGNLREAYSQYLRLIEQYPNDVAGLKALSEMAADSGEWVDAETFVTRALAAAPDDLALQATRLLVTYGQAVERSDSAAILKSVDAARALREKTPENLTLYKVIIDDLIRGQSLSEALGELNKAIAIAPTEKLFYAQRLSVNAALQDNAAVERGLIEMIEVFPKAPEMPEALLRWYLSRKDFDKAEAFLRQRSTDFPDDLQNLTSLVRFLGEYRGADAALAELDRLIESGQQATVFRSARAGFHFDQGDRDGAIAEMEALLDDVDDADEARSVRVALARMKLAVGDSDGARALVDEVLSEDSGNVEAIKLRATWQIMDDDASDAVAILRDAVDQNPRDASLLTLMAQAYERDGQRDLMRDTLAQAVGASGRAPAESLRYAQLLASENKLLPAEGVLVEALRLSPGNAALLVPLGQLYVALQDWPRAEAVVRELEKQKDPRLANDIGAIRASILQGQQKAGDALDYLERLASTEGKRTDAKVAVLRNHLANGRNAEALAYAAKILAEDPDNKDVQFIHATVLALTGDQKGAESEYRALLVQSPDRTDIWMALVRAVALDPVRREEALALLDQALTINPSSGELRWAKAGILEGKGDIEGAIAIYEALYQENSANPIVANNLASLLSSYRTDADSLRRAEIIARRLRSSDVPAYQDTYGWIAYLNGNFADALRELEKAAAGLPRDPMVQYHLAMTYKAAGANADAANRFAAALALVSEDDSRTFVISAKEELERLKAAGFAPDKP
ncbi:tetratricopeptide repeat protein [Frigidibacter sp. RF13]|uniref:tetratricopeptide repeat protein n=1 Tax=Frigidibacter sp. RF13 TaxID=2997340 RepID=UPI00226FFE4D|nr:tetratricopeptide repeat protein [Frigidibacter sp. RF13]MCY1128068.1 tetratricopeptide repeat protein [Frigidibacter sp. RF13]